MGEEYGSTGEGSIWWIIDPVDGTRPFICGIPVWGTLIGVMLDGVAKLGIMSQPHTKGCRRSRIDRDYHGATRR